MSNKTGWVKFDLANPETHPEEGRKCQLVSDKIAYEEEAIYAFFDGQFCEIATGYALEGFDEDSDFYTRGLMWHYITLPPKP